MRIRKIDEAPKKLLIDRVRAVLYLEAAKPVDEMNSALAAECAEFLAEIENRKRMKNSEKEAHLSEIFGKPVKLYKHNVSGKALIVAACLVIILLLASIATVAFSDNLDSIVQQFAYKLTEMFGGESADYMGSEIIKAPKDSEEQWLSFDEFLSCCDKGILYPAELPEGLYVTEVIQGKSFDNQNKVYTDYSKITYITNDVNAMSVIATNSSGLMENILNNDALSIETVNGFDCYISSDGSFIQAYIIYKDYVYTISAPNHEILTEIINGLKEIE